MSKTMTDWLKPPSGNVNLVLDTDTYNEIDDQFALVYAAISSDKLNLKAVHAAPFHNNRSSGPADGMEKSYEEIERVLASLKYPSAGKVFRGADRFLDEHKVPVDCEAAQNLIKLGHEVPAGERLYVAAVGAITNVASALLLDQSLADKLVVVWLGGHPLYWGNNYEFNFQQDPHSVQVVLDSKVPFVQVPCKNVAEHLRTTEPEMASLFQGKGDVGEYLYRIYVDYCGTAPAVSKVIWDISAIAWLLDGEMFSYSITSAPLVNIAENLRWERDDSRHPYAVCTNLNRDKIFRDLVTRLENYLKQ